jgi:hypothetical protein
MEALAHERKEKEITALTIKIRQLAGEHLPDIIDMLINVQDNPGAAGPAPADVEPAADKSLH